MKSSAHPAFIQLDLAGITLLWTAVAMIPVTLLGNALYALSLGSVAGVTLYSMCALHKRRLDARSSCQSANSIWQVWSQGEQIANLHDSDIAKIEREVDLDYRTHLAQIYALFALFGQLLWSLAKVLPVLAFWLLAWAYATDPDHLASLTATQVVTAIEGWLVPLTFVVFLPAWALRHLPDLTRVSSDRVARAVAKRIDAHASHIHLKRVPL